MEHQFKYNNSDQEEVCKWLGFFVYWSSSTMFTFTFGIIIYTSILVISHIISNENKITKWVLSWRYRNLKIDLLSTIPPVLVSFILAWVPYIKHSYGLSGPFCWVQSTRYDENCTKIVDITSEVIYYGLYEIVGFVSVILCIVFFVIYCIIRKQYRLQKAQNLFSTALTLMIFQIIYVLLVSFQLIVRLITPAHKSYEIWMAYALIGSLRQLIFPLACLFSFFSLMKLSEFVPFKMCSKKLDTRHYHKLSAKTAPGSTRVSQLSSTYCIISHPASNYATYGSVLEETI